MLTRARAVPQFNEWKGAVGATGEDSATQLDFEAFTALWRLEEFRRHLVRRRLLLPLPPPAAAGAAAAGAAAAAAAAACG